MLQKPEKPKNYNRDYSVIFLLALLLSAGLVYFRVKHFTLIGPIAFITIVPHWWFRKYYKQVQEYESARKAEIANSIRPLTTRSVNENIAIYTEEQRVKKANKKWWQFWV